MAIVVSLCICGNAGEDKDGRPVYIQEIWPSRDEILVRIHLAFIVVSVYTNSLIFLQRLWC